MASSHTKAQLKWSNRQHRARDPRKKHAECNRKTSAMECIGYDLSGLAACLSCSFLVLFVCSCTGWRLFPCIRVWRCCGVACCRLVIFETIVSLFIPGHGIWSAVGLYSICWYNALGGSGRQLRGVWYRVRCPLYGTPYSVSVVHTSNLCAWLHLFNALHQIEYALNNCKGIGVE